MAKALSSKRNDHAAGCLIPFFAVFFLIGCGAFFVSFLRPMLGVLQARHWTPTPCVIKSSAVATNGKSKNRTYSPDILYAYSFGSAQYDSTQWNPFGSFNKSPENAQRIADQFPVGATKQCYVNPVNPSQAMLDRSIPSSAWAGLMTLLFVAVGAGGMSWQFISLRTGKTNQSRAQNSWQPNTVLLLNAGPNLILKPLQSRTGKCFGMAIFALIWNAFIIFFFWKVVLDGSGGGFSRIFGGLFIIPFGLIGLLVLGGAFSSFLGLFNAGLQLSVNRIDAAPGEGLDLAWQMQPGQIKPQDLSITLQGREEATYRRGTDTITEKNIFHTNEIVQTAHGAAIKNGQALIPIPADTMHSMEVTNNKIIWSLKVHGAVRLWPDIDEEYLLLVVPQRGVAQSSVSQTKA